MKVDKLMDAIGAIVPEHIEEAEQWDGAAAKRRRMASQYARWRKILLPMAACLALVVAGGTAGLWYVSNAGHSEGTDTGGAADMAAGSADAGGSYDGGNMSGSNAIHDDAEAEMQDALAMQESVADEEASGAGMAAVWELIVNDADALSITVADHAAPAYEKYFTAEELEIYYGIRILPEGLPWGIALVGGGETPYVIGYDGNDAVMDDNCKLVFSDDGIGRELEIAARTVDMGEMRGFAGEDLKPSCLYGQEVTVVRVGDEYLAIYEKEGVTVTVWSLGLSEEEFETVLVGLLGA